MDARRRPGGPAAESLTRLRGVSGAMERRLARLGLGTIEELLFHLPLRYEDRTRLVPIGSLRPGHPGLVEARVDAADVVFRGRRQLLVHASDGTGKLLLRFFHFSKDQQAAFTRGVRIRAFGDPRVGRGGVEMVHPRYRLLTSDEGAPVEQTLTPIYPATDGVRQGTLLNLTRQALEGHLDGLIDYLPSGRCRELGLPSLHEALQVVHRPPADVEVAALTEGGHPSVQRLAIEEMLAHHLGLKRQREGRHRYRSFAIGAGEQGLKRRLVESLPFPLTVAQRRVIDEIDADLARPHPMLRLLQGDVGSGKTIVAAAAAVQVADQGYQAALMAPTEILAEQHFRNLSQWLPALGLNLVWLTGRHKGRTRQRALDEIASGAGRIVIGTHALFQEQMRFHNLALVVIDEQHKFGVHQRLTLRQKGDGDSRRPHQLIMTATPIPRSLAMTFYADLDTSIIDELPPGRMPVETVAVSSQRRGEVVARIASACAEGRQAYWVCPLIDDSDVLDLQAAESTRAALADALTGLTVGLVHGRLKSADKERVMQQFAGGQIDLLVATTVIEVGVDVPNASLMVIENAERFGLAQLHQLRGRVGRGSEASTCVLMYEGRLSSNAQARIAAMRETSDGFEIARRDLALRGPGEILGTRQTGTLGMKIADLGRDANLLPTVLELAKGLEGAPAGVTDGLLRRWIGARPEVAEV